MCLIFSNKFYRHLNCVLFCLLICFQFGYNQNVSDISQHKLNDTNIVDYSYLDTIYDEYSDGGIIDTPVVTKDNKSSKDKSEKLDTAESIQQNVAQPNGKAFEIPMNLGFSPNNRGAIDFSTLFKPYVSPPLEINPFELFDKDSKKDLNTVRPLTDISKLFDSPPTLTNVHQNQDLSQAYLTTTNPQNTVDKLNLANSGDPYHFYKVETEVKPPYIMPTNSDSNTGSYDQNIAFQNLKSPFDANNFNVNDYFISKDVKQGAKYNDNQHSKPLNPKIEVFPNSGGVTSSVQQLSAQPVYEHQNYGQKSIIESHKDVGSYQSAISGDNYNTPVYQPTPTASQPIGLTPSKELTQGGVISSIHQEVPQLNYNVNGLEPKLQTLGQSFNRKSTGLQNTALNSGINFESGFQPLSYQQQHQDEILRNSKYQVVDTGQHNFPLNTDVPIESGVPLQFDIPPQSGYPAQSNYHGQNNYPDKSISPVELSHPGQTSYPDKSISGVPLSSDALVSNNPAYIPHSNLENYIYGQKINKSLTEGKTTVLVTQRDPLTQTDKPLTQLKGQTFTKSQRTLFRIKEPKVYVHGVPIQPNVPVPIISPIQHNFPLTTDVPIESGVPLQFDIPPQSGYQAQSNYNDQNNYPVKSISPVELSHPGQTSYPIKSNSPIELSHPVQNNYPVKSSYPIESTYPVQNSFSFNSNYPVQSSYPVQSGYSAQSGIPHSGISHEQSVALKQWDDYPDQYVIKMDHTQIPAVNNVTLPPVFMNEDTTEMTTPPTDAPQQETEGLPQEEVEDNQEVDDNQNGSQSESEKLTTKSSNSKVVKNVMKSSKVNKKPVKQMVTKTKNKLKVKTKSGKQLKTKNKTKSSKKSKTGKQKKKSSKPKNKKKKTKKKSSKQSEDSEEEEDNEEESTEDTSAEEETTTETPTTTETTEEEEETTEPPTDEEETTEAPEEEEESTEAPEEEEDSEETDEIEEPEEEPEEEDNGRDDDSDSTTSRPTTTTTSPTTTTTQSAYPPHFYPPPYPPPPFGPPPPYGPIPLYPPAHLYPPGGMPPYPPYLPPPGPDPHHKSPPYPPPPYPPPPYGPPSHHKHGPPYPPPHYPPQYKPHPESNYPKDGKSYPPPYPHSGPYGPPKHPGPYPLPLPPPYPPQQKHNHQPYPNNVNGPPYPQPRSAGPYPPPPPHNGHPPYQPPPVYNGHPPYPPPHGPHPYPPPNNGYGPPPPYPHNIPKSHPPHPTPHPYPPPPNHYKENPNHNQVIEVSCFKHHSTEPITPSHEQQWKPIDDHNYHKHAIPVPKGNYLPGDGHHYNELSRQYRHVIPKLYDGHPVPRPLPKEEYHNLGPVYGYPVPNKHSHGDHSYHADKKCDDGIPDGVILPVHSGAPYPPALDQYYRPIGNSPQNKDKIAKQVSRKQSNNNKKRKTKDEWSDGEPTYTFIAASENHFQTAVPQDLGSQKDRDDKDVPINTSSGPNSRTYNSYTFPCKGKADGFYADVNLNCEVYYKCKDNGIDNRLKCPSGMRFNKTIQTCDFGHQVMCGQN